MNKNKINMALKQLKKCRQSIEESNLEVTKEFLKMRSDILKLELYLDSLLWETKQNEPQNEPETPQNNILPVD